MAIDRETYIDVFHNVAKLEKEGLPVQTYWHTAIGPAPGWRLDPKDSKFGENAKYYKYDIAEAKKLLAAAGYGNGLEIITSYIKGTELNTNGSNFQKTAEVRQDMLRAIGVKPRSTSSTTRPSTCRSTCRTPASSTAWSTAPALPAPTTPSSGWTGATRPRAATAGSASTLRARVMARATLRSTRC